MQKQIKTAPLMDFEKFLWLGFLGLWMASPVLARTEEPLPDINAWIAEVRDSALPMAEVPRRVLLLEAGIEVSPEKNYLSDGLAIEKISPLFFIDESSAKLSSKLNQDSGAKPSKARQESLASTYSANVIFAGVKGKTPILYTNDGKRLRKIGPVMPYKGDKSPNSILTWIYQCLGYDGIILARKGPYVIVGGPASTLSREKIQALAIRGSESHMALLDKKRSGISLLELQISKGGYGIFKILALAKDSKELPIATKLTIQRDSAKTEKEPTE